MFKKKNEDVRRFDRAIKNTIKCHKVAMKRKRKLIRELAGLKNV